MQWYYSNDGQRFGPVPHPEMDRLIQVGTVKGDTLLWKQGMVQWTTLDDLRVRNPAMFGSALPPPVPGATPDGGETRATINEAETDGPRPARRPIRLEPEESKPVAPEVLIYAGFWARAGAFVVDMVLWGMVWHVVSNVVVVRYFPEALKVAETAREAGLLSFQPTPEELRIMTKFQGVVLLITIIWTVLYDLIFIPRFGATPGKLLFGLRLVTARNKPLGFLRIVARALARVLSGVPTLFIGFFVVGVDDQKRGLHDFFCGTRVVKKRPAHDESNPLL